MPFIDLTGQTFNRLTVIERAKNSSDNKAQWKCQCVCGNIIITRAASLKAKFEPTQSCGCLQKEYQKALKGIKTHGMTNTAEYSSWEHIVQRCTNPKNDYFHNYGARGITLCDEWRNDFMAFYNHVGKRPSAEHSIDRINNDGNYEPGNVRWATRQTQANNTRTNRKITIRDWTLTIAQWARFVGINQDILWHRIQAGWPHEKAIFSPTKIQFRNHNIS